ncbi:LIC_10190 family membrane protein [Lacinutrix chionoecetis]
MFLILLSWITIFICALIFGVATNRLLKLETQNSIITLFFGLFSITLLTGFWSIFFAVNIWFSIVILSTTIVFFFLNKPYIFKAFKQFIKKLKTLTPIFKVLLAVVTILLLAKCATAPFLVDNETYYIQTIKWLNQFGFTKGLINLHPFLGQTSGWHILQSAFNFDYATNRLNDLSGFALLLGNAYAFFKLNSYFKSADKIRIYLVIGLFPVLNLFLFQFVSSPSPDIAIYVLALIIFCEFVTCYKTFSKQAFYSVFVLCVFAIFIKLTAVFFLVLPLILYKRYYIFSRKYTLTLLIISGVTFGLFAIKNIIITGNVLFPITNIEALKTNWSLPPNIANYLSHYEKAASYGLTVNAYENASAFQLIKAWVLQSKLDGAFNSVMLILLIISPFYIFKTKHKTSLFIIYSLAVFSLILLLFFSPQYRFFFPFLMFLVLLVFSFLFKKKAVVTGLLSASVVLPIIPLVFNIEASVFTNTKTHQNTSVFSSEYLLEPHPNSRYDTNYRTLSVGNMTIHSLSNGSNFIWETGNAPLPALSEQQLNYFKTYFYSIPQQYSTHLKDGFYSKSVNND